MVFSAIKNIKIQCGIEGKLMKKKCKEDTVGMQKLDQEGRNFRYGCENFARIAKISQS